MSSLVVSTGSKINFFRQAPTGNWKIFFSRHMEKCGRQKVTIKFFLCSETQATHLIDLAENQSYCLYNYRGMK